MDSPAKAPAIRRVDVDELVKVVNIRARAYHESLNFAQPMLRKAMFKAYCSAHDAILLAMDQCSVLDQKGKE